MEGEVRGQDAGGRELSVGGNAGVDTAENAQNPTRSQLMAAAYLESLNLLRIGPVASRSAIRRARWNSAISSCSPVVWIFRWPQPSVTVGMPWAVSQLASSPPLVMANSGLGLRPQCGHCRSDTWFVAVKRNDS